MIIRREAINAVLPAVIEDDSWYHWINVEPDGTLVTTNGHVLLTAKDKGALPDEDFPQIPGQAFTGTPDHAVLIPADVAKSLVAATPKKSRLPILGCIQLMKGTENGHAVASATDLQAPRVANLKHDETQNFPEWERVMPKADRKHRKVILSIEVLEILIKAAKAANPGRSNGRGKGIVTIHFEIPTSDRHYAKVTRKEEENGGSDKYVTDTPDGAELLDQIRVTIPSNDLDVIGVVMPCRA